MKDFFGNVIQVGDEVAFSSLETAKLVAAKVVNISKKQVTVEVEKVFLDGTVGKRKISKKPEYVIIKPWVSIF